MTRRIALAADNGEWHRHRLAAALAARGVEPVLISLADIAILTGAGEPLRLPGFDGRLPDGLLLRTLSGGTFEATTLRLGVLHALVAAGVTVWNSPWAIERSVDKSMSSLLFARSGLPTPDTFVVSTREAAGAIVAREAEADRPLVLKPLFGSQGKGLRLVHAPAELPAIEEVAGVYYLQRFVQSVTGSATGAAAGKVWRDYRVLVCAGEAIAGMVREGDGWITNLHQGGRPLEWCVPAAAASLAEAAARAVGIAYGGIDLIADGEGGFLVLEVNSMPSWSGLQCVTGIDIAATIVDAFLAAVGAGQATQPSSLASEPALAPC